MGGCEQRPRSGLLGAWDRLVGPDATTLENLGLVGGAVMGAYLGATGGGNCGRSWGPLRRATAALVGADLYGGVWTNATPTARRWYHGRGQGACDVAAFAVVHLHPFLVSALYRERDWRFAWGNYAYLLAATAAIASTPAAYRLAVALALYLGAVWANLHAWEPTPGMEWFAPAFFLKLLVSHAAGEVPAGN